MPNGIDPFNLRPGVSRTVPGSRFMYKKQFFLAALAAALSVSLSGCAVVTVASTAVTVGVAAGSVAVGAASTVARGAVSLGGAVLSDDDED